MKEINGSSVLILGYGCEGQSSHRYLVENFPNKQISIADLSEVSPVEDLPPPIEVFTGKSYLDSVNNFDVVIRSPGISSSITELISAKKEGVNVTSETNLFFSECPGLIIGITGTKGKSTTSSLITDILSKSYSDVRLVGNIGKPALDHLRGADPSTLFVVELSSHQLEDARYSPHIAVVLAIYQEHLSHHGTFADYVKAKQNITRFQGQEGIVVFNPIHKESLGIAEQSRGKKYRFGIKRAKGLQCYKVGNTLFYKPAEANPVAIIDIKDVPLFGKGNIENVLAAISVGVLLRVPIADIRKSIYEFKPLSHRMEFIGEYHGIRFYNDSLSTIPEATINAMEALGMEVETLILGGFDRGVSYKGLAKYLINRLGLKNLILFPTTGKKIWSEISQLTSGQKKLNKFNADSMLEAVSFAFANTGKRKICLLSPASSSFGLFENYEERGELFKQLVKDF
ncbi:MAG: UDP-N-acetylmuramoylalanine--D-glutamate ligase [Candidatus Levybacteria bacterium RBG_16_35_11]|nr:MAG: UDP-N-acetylmuramoylalanine--D-glutamate ligase [Candidatus Levybacteria bacterium RBG_16_35_11]